MTGRPPRSPPRSDLIRDHTIPVPSCLLCSGLGRRIIGETDAGTFVVRCARCHLHRASHVVPTAVAKSVRGWTPAPDGAALLCGLGLAEGGDPAHVLVLDHWDHSLGGDDRVPVVAVGAALLRTDDPIGCLRRVREELLEPGGLVIAEVPNVNSLARRVQRTRWSKWQPGEHYWYPDEWALRQLLYRSGFETRVLKSASGRDLATMHPARRTVARAIDRLGYGSSLVAVGRAR